MASETKLALEGGAPVRSSYLPYGLHSISEEDISKVVSVLKSDWITQGPNIDNFENKLREKIGCPFVKVVSSGTAALHLAVLASEIKKGDEVITTPYTFAASANAILYAGATPVFADVDAKTLNIDPASVASKITKKTKAIVAVHFAGLPCDLNELKKICKEHSLCLIEDAAHALGAKYHGTPVGCDSFLATLSFHPVKHITTGEGGAICTNDETIAEKIGKLRTHGIRRSAGQRYGPNASWEYDMEDLGFNYRLTDLQSVLGLSQLNRLDEFVKRRNELAEFYEKHLAEEKALILPSNARDGDVHAWHLYVVRLNQELLTADRNQVFAALRAENIGVNVHYLPVYFHSYYQKLGYKPGLCPVAEKAFETALTLPLFPKMSEQDARDVVTAVKKVLGRYGRR